MKLKSLGVLCSLAAAVAGEDDYDYDDAGGFPAAPSPSRHPMGPAFDLSALQQIIFPKPAAPGQANFLGGASEAPVLVPQVPSPTPQPVAQAQETQPHLPAGFPRVQQHISGFSGFSAPQPHFTGFSSTQELPGVSVYTPPDVSMYTPRGIPSGPGVYTFDATPGAASYGHVDTSHRGNFLGFYAIEPRGGVVLGRPTIPYAAKAPPTVPYATTVSPFDPYVPNLAKPSFPMLSPQPQMYHQTPAQIYQLQQQPFSQLYPQQERMYAQPALYPKHAGTQNMLPPSAQHQFVSGRAHLSFGAPWGLGHRNSFQPSAMLGQPFGGRPGSRFHIPGRYRENDEGGYWYDVEEGDYDVPEYWTGAFTNDMFERESNGGD